MPWVLSIVFILISIMKNKWQARSSAYEVSYTINKDKHTHTVTIPQDGVAEPGPRA